MIMTHTEETSMTFESKTPTGQMNGHSMASTEGREEEQNSNTSSPTEGRRADETSGSSVLEMGSTDSAGSAHGGSSCGLVSSLFPNCHRVEAFARHLQRRLTSLGSEASTQHDEDPTKPKETSWLRSSIRPVLNTSSTNRVLQDQPRHNPETGLCYDFDLEFEDGLSSPAEEATAAEVADLLVNPEVLKTNQRGIHLSSPNGSKDMLTSLDSDTGYVFASPLMGTSPESDSSDIFFDPESSEAEKKNEVYFDPITTSDSEVTTSNPSNRCDTKPKHTSCRKKLDLVEYAEDTSESSASLKRNNFTEFRENDLVCSSEDSKSSQETTSHESLWSTFDESTVSLSKDETLSNIKPDSLQNRLPKSHSDSEIPAHEPKIVITDRREAIVEQETDEVDFVKQSTDNDKLETIDSSRKLVKDESPDSSDNTNEEDLPYDEEKPQEQAKSSLKVDENETGDGSTYSSMINIPGALTLECSTGERVTEPTMVNEVQLRIENGAVTNSCGDDKLSLLAEKIAASPCIRNDTCISPRQERRQSEGVEEEGEEEEDRPQKIRRSSSLKTGKTPPGTPGRKKIVRFADVLGLDLADVRTFLDEIPRIPTSAYSDLIHYDLSTSVAGSSNVGQWPPSRHVDSRRGSSINATLPSCKMDRILVPLFQQPGGQANFLDLVRERRVCLENALVQDPINLCVHGTVRVINLDFNKSVHIRYTLNSWGNFSDLQATYVPNSCDGFSDKFSFVVFCHTLQIGQRMEFAVRFQVKGEQYWDNNAGVNYCFQCVSAANSVSYMPSTSSDNHRHEWSSVFY